MSSLTVQDYSVGWICALNIELTAAMAMLDEEHGMMAGQDPQDHNSYVLGRIHQHNVVIACMPEGVDGLVPAANVAKDMARTFPTLRIGLMVGIGGGVPALTKGIDIRLGDIVVSKPEKTWGGVVQYDKGEAETEAKFVVKGQLNQPPALLLHTLAQLRARHAMLPSKVPDYIEEAIRRNPVMEESGFILPTEPDCLYCSVCDKDIENPVADCEGFHAKRKQRKNNNPMVHYGVVASANQVVKDAAVRDRLRDEYNALCVEMEAAGLMNEFPCLVIRGICDYADVRKNDVWHRYAAMTAAAYAKEFLQYISPTQTKLAKPIQEIVASLDNHLAKQSSLVEEHLHEVKREHEKQDQRYQDNQHRQCHRALKTSTYEQFKDVNPDRVDGTCQWVLSHTQYIQWYTNTYDDLLWISADPGCGKSVLAKSLVDNELRNTDQQIVCYFFFKDNEEQDNVVTALCALLHQLFSQQPGLISHAIPAWEKSGDKVAKEAAELWRILLAAARVNKARRVTCVLDALDECRSSDRRWLIETLSRLYTQASASPSPSQIGRLKFLVTSRPYDDIGAEFQKTIANLPTIRLRGEEKNEQIRQEIDLVIRLRVRELSEALRLDSDTKDQLETKLLEMKHRTYLWLYLAIEDIRKTYRNSLRLEEVSLKSLPSSVEDAYERILSRVDQEQRGNVKKIFQIVVGARRPLHVEEMAIALGIATSTNPKSLRKAKLDPGRLENNIRDWCGLFVFINHGRIYLIHQTAKEFLIGKSDSATFPFKWKNCLDLPGTGREITRICVELLSFDDVRATADSLTRRLKSRGIGFDFIPSTSDYVESFLAYSAEHWPSHLREACLTKNDSALSEIVAIYKVDGRLYNLWFPIFWMITEFSRPCPKMNAIQLGGLLGHENILDLMLQQKEDYDIDESDWCGTTALIWASKYGHEKAVQMLLAHGANVNTQGVRYGDAIQAASADGHGKIVQILLDHGADVNIRGEYCEALEAASRNGHEKVVQILLEHRAGVNTQGGGYGTALQAASQNGRERVVQLLLDHGANVNTQGGQYGTALQAASLYGHERVVQLLLDHGANVNTQGGRYGTALQAASLYGHERAVQLLLDHGANVNTQGGEYGTALQAASSHSLERVVQILLDRGADVNTQGGLYGTALQAASSRGLETIVQILLNYGADVNIQGGEYGNALYTASQDGHEKVVQILLDHGADVNIQGGEYSNALQAALFRGHKRIVQILLEYGADVNTPRKLYGSALQVASCCSHEKVVQLLLDHGANVNTQGGKFNSALQVASLCGHEGVIQLLLKHGANVNALGGECGTALQAASQDGHEKVVQILLEQGADVNAQGGQYGNALQAASAGGHEKVVQILLKQGAYVDAEGGEYGNALQAASCGGREKLVQMLLDEGADVNAQGGRYGNALQAASTGGHEKVVQMLLKNGANRPLKRKR